MTEFVATPAELQAIVTFTVMVAFSLVAVIWWLAQRIEDGCPICPHCQEKKRARKAEQEARDRAFAMRYYNWDGKEMEPPKKRPRGGSQRDEGPDKKDE